MQLPVLSLILAIAIIPSITVRAETVITDATITESNETANSDWGDDDSSSDNTMSDSSWGSDNFSDSDWGDDDWEDTQSPWQPVTGFVEVATGQRLQDDSTNLPNETLNEARLRIESGYQGEVVRATIRADLRYDDVVEGWESNVRDLSFSLPIGDAIDLKLGRQVLTWGTGDFLFLNDLFAKDWQAFFIGLEDEYLKAPANAAKASYFGSRFNVDLVWTPRFEADNYINGERLSFFNPTAGINVAPDFSADTPNDDAVAARLFGSKGSAEYALYGYWGYTGRPEAVDDSGSATFAELDAYGASLLSPLGSGLANVELSYQDIGEQDGGDVSLPMDKFMALMGYQQEIAASLTLGLQYQWEHYLDYDEYADNYPYTDYLTDENRQLATVRLNYRAMQEKLNLSLFTFYSPTDEDYYVRPQVSYRVSDVWSLAIGANLLDGEEKHTFFSQLEDNSNAWFRVRFNY